MKWNKIRYKTGAGYSAAFIFIVVYGLVIFKKLSVLNESSNLTDQTCRDLSKIDLVISGLNESEVSQRVFLILGDESYFKPFQEGYKLTFNNLDIFKESNFR